MVKKINSRSFVYILMLVIVLFGLFHVWTWETFTRKLLEPSESIHIGDLSRIGYQYDALQVRKTEITLPRQHIRSAEWDGERVDIVTYGDSFSIGAAGGLNPYYQDFIATRHNLKVLNIERNAYAKDEDFLNDLIGMINGGFMDHLKPKIVLVESVERLALLRMAQDLRWEETFSIEESKNKLKNNVSIGQPEDIPIINSGNYKFFLYKLYYQFSPNAFDRSSVHRYLLNRKCFDSEPSDVLLFYNQDITSLGMINKENVKKMNDNLNQLANILKKKNIELIFMPAVDKYDLYYPYIINNIHEKNSFFDLLRPLDKQYYWVDTKKILSRLIEENVSNVYYRDDTHWSYKASEAVIASIPFYNIIGSITP